MGAKARDISFSYGFLLFVLIMEILMTSISVARIFPRGINKELEAGQIKYQPGINYHACPLARP